MPVGLMRHQVDGLTGGAGAAPKKLTLAGLRLRVDVQQQTVGRVGRRDLKPSTVIVVNVPRSEPALMTLSVSPTAGA